MKKKNEKQDSGMSQVVTAVTMNKKYTMTLKVYITIKLRYQRF